MADLVDPEALLGLLSFLVPYKNAVLQKLYGAAPLEIESVAEEYRDYGARLAPYVADTSSLVHRALEGGETVLLEGAQGSLLDLDSGTYEYVTSSVPSSLAAGAAIGMGIGPTQIQTVLGVYKAYNTRVGNGPMPTELHDETGRLLREGGPKPEYGSTTGRPRRCGWFDGVAARHSVRVNGLSSAALTRLDVLDPLPMIKVCTAYRVHGDETDSMPAAGASLAAAQPVYTELPGWQKQTAGMRRFEDLPPEAQSYVRFIRDLLGVPICLVSVGPEREQAIRLERII
jgi:adenylosuccinate synthase